MANWIISDTHFLHSAIARYCNRPQNFDAIIQENWNRLVQPNDTIYHLGDFAAGVGKVPDGFHELEKIALGLNGTKILIRGNHDWYQDCTYISNFGFSEVNDYLEVDDYFLCHYPLEMNQYTTNLEKDFIDLFNEFNQAGDKQLIHGHSHLTHYAGKINASVDLHNYGPIPFPK